MGDGVNITFILGDRLPTYYDAAIAIFSVCRNLNCAKMTNTVTQYSEALINIWEHAFGSSYVMSRKAVNDRIDKLVHHYYNNVNFANFTNNSVAMCSVTVLVFFVLSVF